MPDTHYLGPEAVDSLAFPATEWNVDLSGISPHENHVIELRVFISETGNLDSYEVIQSTATSLTLQALLEPLSSTLLLPAIKDGMPVPSYRQVQFVIQPGY